MICDHKYRVTSMSARWPGSVHDARVFRGSSIRDQFENGMHNGFLLGDGGYPCNRYLLTPYLHPTTVSQERYNSSLCRTRVRVEQTFGIMKQRFQCLRNGIQTTPEKAVQYTSACVVLHNIGIDRNDIVNVNEIQLPVQHHVDFAPAIPDANIMRDHVANTYF